MGRAAERQAEHDRLEAERAERATETTPAPIGTVAVEGEIVSLRTEPGRFSYYGSQTTMLVQAAGYRVWATRPAALAGAGVRDKVRFVAELVRSGGDDSFAFGKRPRRAEVLTPALARVRVAAVADHRVRPPPKCPS